LLCSIFEREAKMIADLIRANALARPHQPAIVSITKQPLLYAGLHRQIEYICAQLRRAGLSTEARIGVALLDGPEAVLAILAVSSYAAAVPINNRLGPDDLRQLFAQARLDAVLLNEAAPPLIRDVANDFGATMIKAAPIRDNCIALSLHAPERPLAKDPEPRPGSIALILQTSGTTGKPKLVPITHENLEAEAAKIGNWFKLPPEDRCLNFLPLCYAHGLREALFPPILTGGSIARPENHVDLDIITWLARLEPTWYSNFPTFHQSVYELTAASGNARLAHRLRFVLSAGTPLSASLQQGLEQALGVPVLEFFGIGEAGHMAANLPPPGPRRPGTCGIPLPGEMMIALDGRALPANAVGEVLVRGPTVISGYLDDPEANAAAFHDGWFRTGDLGSIDKAGFLSIHGRLKELINRGGEKLSPIEVERALLRHPAVADAAACGIPHPRLGEDVAAAVVLRDGSMATAAELRTFAGELLTPFKVPRQISIIRDLPKDVTGKIRRQELSALLASAATAASSSSASGEVDSPLAVELMQLWRELLKCESIGLDDDFFAKGGDSLLAARMRLAVEKMTGVVLPAETPFTGSTIRRLTQAIAECDELRTTPILTECSAGDGRPFFYFHGDCVSDGFYVRRLAQLVGNAARVVSVAPHRLGQEPIPASIQKMAGDRLPLLLAVQPQGPYRLGGYCCGGAVALEVARLLQAAGHSIELIALVDMPLVNAGVGMRLVQRSLAGTLRLAIGDAAKRERLTAAGIELVWWVQNRALLFRQMDQATRLAKLVARLSGGRAPPDPRQARYFSLLASYVPEPLDVPITYYAAEHSGRHLKRISAQGQVVRISSDHSSCISTDIHLVADDLRRRLVSWAE
jgi:acyl-CoA synthetase (AMP-forming)/AMP-acid ligase II/thioesterase domain-containing protein